MNIKLFIIFIFLIPFKLFANDEFCITTEKNFSNYNDVNMYDLDIYISDCNLKKRKIDSFGYFGDTVKNNFYFFQKEKNRLFISTYVLNGIYEENPKYVYDDGKYYFTRVYDCKKLSCKLNEELTTFFGDGGNILQVSNDKIIRKFYYEKEENVKNELNSVFFKNWKAYKIKNGKVLKKTFIKEVPNYLSNNLGYLIKGDEFIIKKISARWLNIIYTNKKGSRITGWIDCNDTNICIGVRE